MVPIFPVAWRTTSSGWDRYIERAESTVRLVRVLLLSISSETEGGPERKLLLRSLAEQGQIDPDYVVSGLEATLPSVAAILPESVFDPARERSLRRSIEKASGLASIVRDRIAIDMWRTDSSYFVAGAAYSRRSFD